MNSAWNWLGIIAWLIVLAYLFFIIHNTHHRKKNLIKLALSRKHQNTFKLSSQNVEITAIEVIVLLVAVFGLVKFHHQHLNNTNSMITAQVQPLQVGHTKINKKHLSQKPAYFYVDVARTKSKAYKQTYTFMINGKPIKASNKSAWLGTTNHALIHDANIPYRAHHAILIHHKLMKHSAGALRLTSVYKNTAKNGLGLLAGKKKDYYTVLKVPSSQWIYLNNHKLHHHKSIK